MSSNSIMDLRLGAVVKAIMKESCLRNKQKSSSVPSSSASRLPGSLEDFCYQVEKERLKKVRRNLMNIFSTKVLEQISRVLGSEIELPRGLMASIVSEIISLSEREPCGVRGGNLVILLSSLSSSIPNLTVGTFQTDDSTVPTFELTLVFHPVRDFKTRIVNFMRKLRGKDRKIVLDRKYSIVKKKLYLESI